MNKLIIFCLLIFFNTLVYGGIDYKSINEPVFDELNTLNPIHKDNVNKKLINLYKQKNIQIQYVIIKSLNNIPIEDYSIKLFDNLKLGNVKSDKGILIIIVDDERKIRIEVGRGLEGDLTDVKTFRIIQDAKTLLKLKKYDDSIDNIQFHFDEIVNKIEKDKLAKNSDLSFNISKKILLIIGIIILLLVISKFTGFDFTFTIIRLIIDIFTNSSNDKWGGGGGGSAGGGSSDNF